MILFWESLRAKQANRRLASALDVRREVIPGLHRHRPPVLETIVVIVLSFAVASASVLTGWYLYERADKEPPEFYLKLGELLLQLAIVVIIGALVKVGIDWGTSQRTRYRETRETKKEFLRRVRAVHVSVANARDLLRAHRSAKTWSEQSRRLMELRPVVEEISEDLKASHRLFENDAEVIVGLEMIVNYLAAAADEYVRCHDDVDRDFKKGRSIAETIDREEMLWVQDFMDGGANYKADYEEGLKKSKGAMRADVYGA